MPGEHQVDCADDVVQEIGLICGVAVGAGENHPIGAAGREHLHRSRPAVGKHTTSGATVSRRLAVQHTLVDRLMVAGLNSPIELRVALRLEGRIAVKGGGEIQQSAWRLRAVRLDDNQHYRRPRIDWSNRRPRQKRVLSCRRCLRWPLEPYFEWAGWVRIR